MSLTPDGVRYLAVAQGQRVARPFHFRWLIPTLCGTHETRWRTTQYVSLVGLLGAACWYGGGWRGLFVAACALGCSGVWKFNRNHPVLVDLPAMTCALFAAAAIRQGWWWLAIPFALIAGMTKETAPLFAALWAWSPVLLIGAFAPVCRGAWRAGDDVLDQENAWILAHPFAASRKYHQRFPVAAWVLPWGVLLFGLAHLSWPLALTLAAAYAQCVIATDTVRLYQWAWPTLALATSYAVPMRWWPVLVVVHVANPFAGEGI